MAGLAGDALFHSAPPLFAADDAELDAIAAIARARGLAQTSPSKNRRERASSARRPARGGGPSLAPAEPAAAVSPYDDRVGL